jgi:SAM-dependent methyltransferase
MFKHTACPACGHTEFAHFLDCKDYTVSQDTFTIVSCKACNFKFTNPVPDPDRIGEYYKAESYISHSDTRKGLIARLYHAVRSFTLKSKLQILENNVSRGTLLDFGCGTGMFLRTCKSGGWSVFGVEPDAGAAELARSGIERIYSDLEALLQEQPNIKFDAITLWHVLEHVPELNRLIGRLKDILNSDGVLVIAVPNYTSRDAAHYGRFWAAYDVPRHLYHFSPESIKSIFSRLGFNLRQMLPMKFDSFYVSMLSEKYKAGRINYPSAFWQGLTSNMKSEGASEYSSVIYLFKK